MKTIKLEYRFLFLDRKLERSIPTRWDEVTPRQLITIARHYLSESSDEQMLSILCGVRKRIIRMLDTYQRFSLANEMSFLKDYKPYSHFIIRKAGQLMAPKLRLEGMSFGQFMFVDSWFTIWLHSRKEDDLNKFIASLYLPDGETFQSESMPELMHSASQVPLLVKLAISINYRLIREFLAHAYPLIFQKPRPGTTPKPGDGWVKVFESVIGDDIVNQDRYAELPLHTVLRWITRKLKENAKRT